MRTGMCNVSAAGDCFACAVQQYCYEVEIQEKGDIHVLVLYCLKKHSPTPVRMTACRPPQRSQKVAACHVPSHSRKRPQLTICPIKSRQIGTLNAKGSHVNDSVGPDHHNRPCSLIDADIRQHAACHLLPCATTMFEIYHFTGGVDP